MGEKNYTKLRQRLGYKPIYKGRKYRIIDRIIEFLRRGKWTSRKAQQRRNIAARAIYREAKKKMKAGQ